MARFGRGFPAKSRLLGRPSQGSAAKPRSRFVDREIEQRSLRDAWESSSAELVIVSGRRRVGKSELLTRFARGKPIAYYVGAQQLERDQLNDLGQALAPIWPGSGGARPPRLALGDWDELLTVVANAAGNRRIGLILDEFPYLEAANPALPSLIQRWWDRIGPKANLVIVLAGSQLGMMRRLVSHDGALYGRPTRAVDVRPFDYFHAAAFAPSWSAEDRVRLYAIAGGIPDYLEEFDDSRSLRDNLARLAYAPDGRLFREAQDLMRAEFTEPRTYESVIRAIAHGARSPSQIADSTGISGANRVTPYLERLMDLAIVERRVPPRDAAEPRPRRSQYVLADGYLRFYYALVDPWRSAIQMGNGGKVLDDLMQQDLDDFVSHAFEDVAREYLRRASAAGLLPPLSEVGFWWYPGGDIDAAGVARGHLVAAGSAKWRREYMKPRDLADLQQAARAVAPSDQPLFFLFSRSGFDSNLRAQPDVRLVTLRELYSRTLAFERHQR
jgi:uncharacterized protein